MNEPWQYGPSPNPWPRRCEHVSLGGGDLWCHGFFQGLVDINDMPQGAGHSWSAPGVIALIERRNLPNASTFEVVGTRWLRLMP